MDRDRREDEGQYYPGGKVIPITPQHGGGSIVLDDTVTQSSSNGVKSSGIWTFVRGLLNALTLPWSKVTDKPTAFPPEAHDHVKADITDFPTTMPPSAHTHAQSDVTGLADALAAKLDKTGTDNIVIVGTDKTLSITNDARLDTTRFEMGGISRSNHGGQAELSLRLGRSGYFAVEEYTLPDNTEEYNEDSTYAVGAFVRYNGALYVCKAAITTAEAWTPAHWTAMPNVSALLSIANTSLAGTIEAKVNAMFDNGETEEF